MLGLWCLDVAAPFRMPHELASDENAPVLKIEIVEGQSAKLSSSQPSTQQDYDQVIILHRARISSCEVQQLLLLLG